VQANVILTLIYFGTSVIGGSRPLMLAYLEKSGHKKRTLFQRYSYYITLWALSQ